MVAHGRQLGTIRGLVLDAAGSPVPDAAVVITRAPGSQHDIAQLTGDDGRFTMPGLPPGLYRLLITPEQGQPARAAVDLAAGAVADVEVRV